MFDKFRERCHVKTSAEVFDNCLELNEGGEDCDVCNPLYFGLLAIDSKRSCKPFLDITHNCKDIFRDKDEDGI